MPEDLMNLAKLYSFLAHGAPAPQRWIGVWWTKCQMQRPTMPFLHSSILLVSMISFRKAAGIHQLTIYPEPLFQLAAKTKHASCGPKLVANMPAPHGHHVGCNFGWFPLTAALAIIFMLCNACSSPG